MQLQLKVSFVAQLPQNFSITPRTLISASAVALLVAAVLGVLNVQKVKGLNSSVTFATAAREAAERARAQHQKKLKGREAAIAAEQTRLAERQAKLETGDAQMMQILSQKTELEAKLHDKESEILALQKQLEETQPASVNPGAASSNELQAQLDDARQQLDLAEKEKSLLSEKVQAVTERSARVEDENKRRAVAHRKVGIQGRVLAVNQAYNFVVLNLGGRNGVEPQTEMLIVRDGTYIGKIRISSVEPTTAIGDIINSTVARGVQVQPGDIVVYAGSNS